MSVHIPGVAYVIDRVLGNCTVRPVENSSFDVSLNYTQTMANGQYFDQMKTSLGLFYLDDTYSYEGQVTYKSFGIIIYEHFMKYIG